MVAPMGAWEDGFAAGYRAGLSDAGFNTKVVERVEGYLGPVRARQARSERQRTRAPSAYNKRLGTALKRINKRARKKDGSYRKGWSAQKVMRMAHKEAKR